ncbi:MAG: type I-F CRISPR-associated endoribonuclease Cas6/Csy4 [Paraglaciecola sp.]|uniref:type I-F CRISPR-associated endoribonuclease Cas6/Csy4 n=1 Tax=Paraglaciecola sp. TaxID=1920173 RepID=UPI0032970D73
MNYYIDIRLQPDAEMRENILLNKAFTKLHKALWDLNSTDIGVSFPEAKVLLGRLVRVHSTAERLQELIATNWLGGLSGYCHPGYAEIQKVPAKIKYRRVSRWQHNMSESHLRRLIKRGSITQDEIKAYKAKMFQKQMTTLPFLEIESTSSGSHHRRYIQMSDVMNEHRNGEFDTFGLSKVATIPWF